MFLCASPHKHRVCVVLLISLRLPYPVCTRFICHILCFASQTPGLCSAFNTIPSAPLPSLRTFYLSCFVRFASQTPGLCSALIALRLPYPVCTRFICQVLCASPHKHRVCVVLPVSLRLTYPVCTHFISHVLCPSPHKHRVCIVS